MAVSEPSPSERLNLEGHASRVVELVQQGRIRDADRHIAAHADLAKALDDPVGCRDAAAWSTMRALLDGRERDARAAIEDVLKLGEAAGDGDGSPIYWWQRFWLVLDWGSDKEKEELLDFCRQRAYWHNELAWRGALTLLLARKGYGEESAREFDVVLGHCANGSPRDATWLDMVTNVSEAAAPLDDPVRARRAYTLLAPFAEATGVVGRAWVCKGSTARVLGQVAATVERHAEANRYFGLASEAHRAMGAKALLARTSAEWGRSLLTRNPWEARGYLEEAVGLAGELHMDDLAADAYALRDSVSRPANVAS